MFLNSLKQRFALIGSTDARQRGAALVGVLGVMGITSIVGLASASMSIYAVGYSTSTRAGVQAEAAAHAGIDFAAANLSASTCQSQYSSATAPIFEVTIAYSTLQDSPGDVDTSWVNGCPTTTSATRLRLISTGRASALGVAGNSSNDVRRVEAIFPYIPTPPSHEIIPSGAAFYSFSQTDPVTSNLTITQASSVRPTVQFLSGSLTCTAGTTIKGDVILGAGSLSITSGCIIDGDLWSSGLINIQSGEVMGDVNSNSDDLNGQSSISTSSSSIIDGGIHARGSVNISGKVGGNIVAGPNANHSTFSNNSSVGGSVITSGTITAPNGVIMGTISVGQGGITTPIIPFVPQWIDYSFNANDWRTSNDDPYATSTLTSCSSSTLANALSATQNSVVPIVLDTRACGAVTDLRGYNLTLTSDTVIIANGFNMSASDIQSSDTNDKRLWLIIPDTIADNQPTCPADSSVRVGNNVTVGSHVAALIYSPCTISNFGDMWRGQMYASSIGTSSSFILNFLPIGLPMANLSTGQFLTPPGTGVLGDRISIRDLTVG